MYELKPPTDNLYKFICIFGLAMMGGGGYVYDKAQRDYDEKLVIASQSIAVSVQHSLMSQINKAYAVEKEEFNRRRAGDTKGLDPEEKRWMETEATMKDMLDVAKQARASAADMDRVNNADKTRRTAMYFASFSFVIGMSFASTGVYFWYTRFQKFQDQMSAVEYQMAKMNLDKTTPSQATGTRSSEADPEIRE